MKTVSWGIIGCGDVTEVKSGPGLQKSEGSRLVAVMRRSGELAQDYARRHGVPRWYDDAEALIRDPEVNAIYIATPPGNHMEYTLAAAKAGKPVFVEKPMARTPEECEEMIRACDQAGVPLFVSYYRRAMPRFVEVKRRIEAGAIGEVRYVRIVLQRTLADVSAGVPWRLDAEAAGGGLFYDLASHTLDWLDYVLGPIREVSGYRGNQAGAYAVEDVVSGAFVFESGVHATGLWSFASYANSDTIEIVGSRGRIVMSTFGAEPFRLETAEGTEEFGIAYPQHVAQPLIQTIVDELRGVGGCPSTGVSAARTNRVMDEMTRQWR